MKISYFLATMIMYSQLSFGQFNMTANCQFNSGRGQCLVTNTTGYILKCALRAQGQLASGHFLEAWQNAIIYPGRYAYVYVYAENPYYNPLVGVQGFANCSY